MTYRAEEHDHTEVLDDARLEFHAADHSWSGIWRDGIEMDAATAQAIAEVENLCWPNGDPK